MEKSALEFLSNQPITGELLAERLAAGPLSGEEALRRAVAIGTALAAIHNAGAVHGSLSPYSIVLHDGGAAILRPPEGFDARTRGYRAPEQVRGKRPDERSDIFAFGALLYQMAAGVPPFGGEGTALDRAILGEQPIPLIEAGRTPDPIAATLDKVIAACIAKDPSERRQRMRSTVLELRLAGTSNRTPAGKGLAERRRDTGRYPEDDKPPASARAHPEPAEPTSAGSAASPAAAAAKAARRVPLVYWDTPQIPRPAGAVNRKLLIRAAFGLMALLAVGLAWYFTRKPEPVVKFTVPAENARFPGMPAVSPDGRFVTYFAVGPEGQRMLWLRSLDASHAKVIPHSDGAFAPFWAPDSQTIGYFSNGALRLWKVNTSPDGTPAGDSQVLCAAETDGGGAAWNKQGIILFSPSLHDGLYRVPAAGGKPEPVLKIDNAKKQRSLRWPQFLPDGRHFLFFGVAETAEATGVYTGELDSAKNQMIFTAETNALFAASAGGLSRNTGYLLFMKSRASAARGGASYDLMGWRFHASSLETEGDPFTLGSNIGAIQTLGFAPISVSDTGILVYQTVEPAMRQLVWMDSGGTVLQSLGEPAEWGPPKIARDGKSVIAGRSNGDDPPHPDLWLLGAGGDPVEVTSSTTALSPVWSPDGQRVAYVAAEADSFSVYVKSAAEGARPELLLKSSQNKHLTDWSRDGRYILFGQMNLTTSWDVWALSVADHHAGPVEETVRNEDYAALSPDGRWIAFQSDESGRYQVYVELFQGMVSGTRRRWQISSAGGALPRWRSDGRQLYFVTSSGALMSAAVHPVANEFAADPPHELFHFRFEPKLQWTFFDVSPEGQRFLMNLPLEWSNSSQITVMTNWTEELKK